MMRLGNQRMHFGPRIELAGRLLLPKDGNVPMQYQLTSEVEYVKICTESYQKLRLLNGVRN